MKKLLLALVLVFIASTSYAQNTVVGSGSLTTSASTCSLVNDVTCVNVITSGFGTASVQISGTWTGTISFEVSNDGTTWSALNVTTPSSTITVSSATANGLWSGSVAGFRYFRARASATMTGTAVVNILGIPTGGGSGGGGSSSIPSGTLGSAAPSTAVIVAGKNNSGNLTAFNFDSSGNLLTSVTGAGSGGTSSVDGAAYTAGTTAGTPLIAVRDDTGTTACAEDKVCIARLTSSRALLVDISGTTANSTAIKVDNSAVTQPISASSLPLPTGAATESTLSTVSVGVLALGSLSSTVGIVGNSVPGNGMMMAGSDGTNARYVKTDTSGVILVPADPFGANSDAVVAAGAAGSISAKLRRTTQGLEDLKTLIVLAAGTNAIGKLSANSGVNIGDIGTVTTITGGGVASGSADSGNPIKTGGKYNSSPITLTNGQRGDTQMDASGYIKVNVAAGSAAGPSDTDDGSIAAAQTVGLNANLNYIYNGSNWVRATSNDATADSAVTTTGPQIMYEAKDQDGAALPVSVQEGDAVRPAASLNGVQYVMAVNEDGSTVGHMICDSGCSGSGGTSSTYGAAFPAAGTAIGGNDGTNMQGLRVVDTDTSGGTFYTLATNLVFRTSGTPVEAGIAANPFNVVFPSAQAVTQSGSNWTINVAQINGVTPLMGAGNTGTGSPRVTLSTDQLAIPTWGLGATGSAVPSGGHYLAGNTAGNLTGAIFCGSYAKDRSTTADVQLVAASGTTNIYICGYAITGESTTTSDVNIRYADSGGCTTNAVDVTSPVTVGTSTSGGMIGGKVVAPGIWSGLKTAATGKQICVHRSAVQTSEVEVWYTQF